MLKIIKRFHLEWSFCRAITTLPPHVSTKNLSKIFHDKIKINGPITVAEYMRESLKTYYNDANVFGSTGDFITSPEISQLYGEMIMVWFINMWEMAGRPTPVNLIELGPGTGVMMMDMLRLLNQTQYKNWMSISIHMVEMSKKYSLEQAKKLNCTILEIDNCQKYYQHGQTSEVYGTKDIFWYHSIDDIPRNKFSFIVAQEFFDALPIHKFRNCQGKWREILIDIENISEGTFRYVLSQWPTPASNIISTIDYFKPSKFTDEIEIEVGFDSSIILDKLKKRIVTDGGIFLCIDYGKDEPIIDSLRAFSGHQQVNPLQNPGSVDLTVDIDFKRLKDIAGVDVLSFGPVVQNSYLNKLHINLRYKNLLAMAKNEREATSLTFGYKQLMEMGSKFKVIAMVPATLAPYLNNSAICGFE
ncbi:protein arginine methyltransferase NDUFAF7 homolog, mitochondrial [Adelges cooleyi]|uniref:protein arginine methyltransferase NDUFAF7 homolog, mitochondrial n=1 Tax=Adelges cooleyi TaxID=133065 RepID=UPI0021801910|nr:protein arginine methyltransferase NDUFAF7 homolog, mitochondrial [Adelges cooleyi]